MDHYEPRFWRGWHHHMTLVILAHHFLVRWQQRLNQREGGPAPDNHMSLAQTQMRCPAWTPHPSLPLSVTQVRLLLRVGLAATRAGSACSLGVDCLSTTPQLRRLLFPSQATAWPSCRDCVGKTQTGSRDRCGAGGSSTMIGSPGRTSPSARTMAMTPALRMRAPCSSRPSTAAISPGWKGSNWIQGLRRPVTSTTAVFPRRKRVPVGSPSRSMPRVVTFSPICPADTANPVTRSSSWSSAWIWWT